MGSPRLFGTDGIRAPFGKEPLDRRTVTALGRQLGRGLHNDRDESLAPPTAVLGGDTRESTPELCRWLTTGLQEAGVRVRYLGVLPTPGVAYLTRDLGADVGIVVSASHNPHPDNGIKLLDGRGYKWSPEAEAALEERLAADDAEPGDPVELPPPDMDLVASYLASLPARALDGTTLAGLSVVLDPGHGAASPYAEPLFRRAGADRVIVLHDAPDGTNINRRAGSTAPEILADAVREAGADLGIAFDGDADRAILVDERGTVRDGDAILYLWATALHRQNELRPPRLVATSMSNLGLARALEREGIELVRCGVGDRVVVSTLQREGIALGGEQSGHIVNLRLSTTGDGLLTALILARLAAGARRDGETISDRLAGFTRYPQILTNVRVREKTPFEELPDVAATARSVEERLGDDGRLVLRYSGTEPLARVMIEGKEQRTIEELADELARSIADAVGEADDAARETA